MNELPNNNTIEADPVSEQPVVTPTRNPNRHRKITYVGLLLIIIGLAGLGLYVRNHRHAAPAAKSSVVNTTKPKPVSWDSYSNDEAGLTFKYPSSWKNQVTTIPWDYGFAGISGTITSPSGNKLTWIYQVIGGKGDAECTPNARDVAFAANNACSSKQILSVQQIPSVTPSLATSFRNMFGDSLYITETKYVAGKDGNPLTGQKDTSPTYQICLDPFTHDEGSPPPTLGTSMGFEVPCNYWDTGFNVEFPVKGAADFNSADAKTAIQMMKSFNSYSAHSPADAVNVVQSAYGDAQTYVRVNKAADQGEVDTIKEYLTAALYAQLSNGVGSGVDQILCAQAVPDKVTASLASSTAGTATVNVAETFGSMASQVVVTVDLSSLQISSIACSQ